MSWNGWIERGLNDFAQYSDNVYTSTPTSTGPSGNPRAPLYYECELSYIQAQGGLKEEDGFGNYQRCYDKTKGAPYLHGWRSRPGNIHDIEDRRIYLPVGPFRPGQPAPFEW